MYIYSFLLLKRPTCSQTSGPDGTLRHSTYMDIVTTLPGSNKVYNSFRLAAPPADHVAYLSVYVGHKRLNTQNDMIIPSSCTVEP